MSVTDVNGTILNGNSRCAFELHVGRKPAHFMTAEVDHDVGLALDIGKGGDRGILEQGDGVVGLGCFDGRLESGVVGDGCDRTFTLAHGVRHARDGGGDGEVAGGSAGRILLGRRDGRLDGVLACDGRDSVAVGAVSRFFSLVRIGHCADGIGNRRFAEFRGYSGRVRGVARDPAFQRDCVGQDAAPLGIERRVSSERNVRSIRVACAVTRRFGIPAVERVAFTRECVACQDSAGIGRNSQNVHDACTAVGIKGDLPAVLYAIGAAAVVFGNKGVRAVFRLQRAGVGAAGDEAVDAGLARVEHNRNSALSLTRAGEGAAGDVDAQISGTVILRICQRESYGTFHVGRTADVDANIVLCGVLGHGDAHAGGGGAAAVGIKCIVAGAGDGTAGDVQRTGTNLNTGAAVRRGILGFDSGAVVHVHGRHTVKRDTDIGLVSRINRAVDIDDGVASGDVAHDPDAALDGAVEIDRGAIGGFRVVLPEDDAICIISISLDRRVVREREVVVVCSRPAVDMDGACNGTVADSQIGVVEINRAGQRVAAEIKDDALAAADDNEFTLGRRLVHGDGSGDESVRRNRRNRFADGREVPDNAGGAVSEGRDRFLPNRVNLDVFGLCGREGRVGCRGGGVNTPALKAVGGLRHTGYGIALRGDGVIEGNAAGNEELSNRTGRKAAGIGIEGDGDSVTDFVGAGGRRPGDFAVGDIDAGIDGEDTVVGRDARIILRSSVENTGDSTSGYFGLVIINVVDGLVRTDLAAINIQPALHNNAGAVRRIGGNSAAVDSDRSGAVLVDTCGSTIKYGAV